MIKKLILVGGGGHCKSVINVAESAGYEILGILDQPDKMGSEVSGYKIIGPDSMMKDFVGKAMFLVTVGQINSPHIRIKLHNLILDCGGELATIISPRASVSKNAVICAGTIVMHNSAINSDAFIGKGCIINTLSNIEHDVKIGDFCHISTGAMINGNCVIGNNVFVGSNSVMINGISITDNCVVGAGSLICNDLQRKGVYYGSPAKFIREF